ncbi:hypothetical protein Kisp01_05430 [Kineosporia sp. NBRC 101677]|uniref:hypothetical protein n=1 Tax=Kineosporia sp. NBRC 101677 TaxID=3032197 RepID=UPI0024A56285|nr:hypothetical protein [Kineosporia sp. NBRC 101677]GLY13527.1 hypothetical protein Kisp01_05430 [Kineosporia sp. NBRC 101677]
MTSFRKWQSEARSALLNRGVDGDTVQHLLDEAREHHRTSGTDPAEALGTPAEFAASVAAEQDDSQVGRVDTQGLTVAEYLCGSGLLLVVMTFVITAVRTVLGPTPQFRVSIAGLAGTASFVLAWLAITIGADALRAAGRPRLAPWSFVAAVALVPVTVLAATALPQDEWFTLSAPVILVGLFLMAAAMTIPLGRNLRPGKADPDPAEPEAWFSRLEGLLVGRHDLPEARAAELVAEARNHAASSDADPRSEFGALNAYAQRLAESLPDRRLPWWRRPEPRVWYYLVLTLIFVAISANAWVHSEGWNTVWPVLLAVGNAVAALRTYRRTGRRTVTVLP